MLLMLKRVTRRDGGRGAAVLLEACCAEPAEPRNAHENIVVNRSNSRAPLQRRTDDAQSNPETARPPAGGMQTHARARAKGHAQPARKAAQSATQSAKCKDRCAVVSWDAWGHWYSHLTTTPPPRLRALCLLFADLKMGCADLKRAVRTFRMGPCPEKFGVLQKF